MNEAAIEKFWISVEQTENCWNWVGPLDKSGLPIIRTGTRETFQEYSPRRLSLQLVGKVLDQSDRVQPLICKNKLCVNPDHLIFGDESRFWSKVNKLGPDDCWEWIGGKYTSTGYGKFSLIKDSGKNSDMGAHRYSYILMHGKIPSDMMVCHMCDNPPCVNPNHLFLGTAKDNAWDSIRKGRNAFGERGGTSKLKEEQVRDIKDTCNIQVLATKYNISVRTILDIIFDKS